MSVRVNGLKEIQIGLASIKEITRSKKMYDNCGREAKDMMRSRSMAGVDVNGRPFIPYSKNSEKSGTPDLTESGKMLDAITFESNDDLCRVYVEGSSRSERINNYDLALVHNEGGKSGKGKGFMMPKREFFGIVLEREWDRIMSIISNHADRWLKVWNR